jgi:hypothetical protein
MISTARPLSAARTGGGIPAPLGQRSGPLYDLVTTLGRYRGTWFDVGDQVMWLRKNDTIGVAPKLVPLPQPEEAEE